MAAVSSAASSVGMARGALRRRLASSKATGRASSPRAMLGGCSTTRFVSVMSYFARRMAWMRANRDCWIVRYMLWGSPLAEDDFSLTDRVLPDGPPALRHPANEDLFAGTPMRAATSWRVYLVGAGLAAWGLALLGGLIC